MKRPNKEKKCPEAGWQVVPIRGQKTATNGRGESRAGGKRRQRVRKNKQTGKRYSRETEGERQQGSFSGQPASTSH